MSRVMVTGATGFIGRHALAPLVHAGHEVHCVGRTVGDAADVTWHESDLLSDPAAVISSVEPELLLHCAWYAEHGTFWTSPENLRWVQASLGLLKAFKESGGERAVFVGTCAEYEWGSERPLGERSTPMLPATLYGAAKHGLHTIASAYCAQEGLGLAWGRVFFLTGPGEAPGRLVPLVARSLLAKQRVAVTHGSQVRDFMAAQDVGEGLAALLLSDVEGPVNVASGVAVTLREIVIEVARTIGGEALIDFGALAERPGEPQHLVADTARLNEEVGWAPSLTLTAAIAAVVNDLSQP